MVCNRCIMVVKKLLEDNDLHPVAVSLGEVVLQEDAIDDKQQQTIQHALTEIGFELIDDRKQRIIEQIKNAVVELVHHSTEQISVKYSVFISEKTGMEYTYLSKLFSEVEGVTIEHYIISQKIERVKELLVYDELSLSEIADNMGYSSVAHLSAQFKKITGLTPTFYKNLGIHHRIPIDKVK